MNPYLPEYEYIPDGEPRVFGNRVYIYGSHDCFGGQKMCMNDYVCYSADVSDLGNWRYEGVIYRKNQDPRMMDGNRELWAPDVIRGKDGRYYLYYCPDGDGNTIGVAVCDTPAGSYSFYGYVHDQNGVSIGRRPQDTDPFDPAVFIDDDGSVYLYSGNGPLLKEYPPQFAHLAPKETSKACVVMTLEDDMITIKSEPRQLIPHVKQADGTDFEKHPFFEASSVRKIGGKYYLVYSSNKMHELCYAISDYPDRDYTFGGVIISNVEMHENGAYYYARNAICNNHGGILELNGNFYIFYHRATINYGHSRQGCAERITVMEDGHIPQTEMTSNGLTGPFVTKGTFPASSVCHLYRKDVLASGLLEQVKHSLPYLTQDGPDCDPEGTGLKPRQYITNMQHQAVAAFRYFDLPAVSRIQVTLQATGKGRLLVQSYPEMDTYAEIPLDFSDNWVRKTVELPEPVNISSICFCYEGDHAMQLLEFALL